MRIQPHENLSVWSLRHDQFWHDRYSPVSSVRERVVRVQDRIHTHIHEHIHVSTEPKHVRDQDRLDLVHQVQSPRPTDCHPCAKGEVDEDAGYTPYMSGGYLGQPGLNDPALSADQGMMLMVIYDKSAISQGFTHGQSVPAAGSMLDIFA